MPRPIPTFPPLPWCACANAEMCSSPIPPTVNVSLESHRKSPAVSVLSGSGSAANSRRHLLDCRAMSCWRHGQAWPAGSGYRCARRLSRHRLVDGASHQQSQPHDAGVPEMWTPLACRKPLRVHAPTVDTPPPRPMAATAPVSSSSQHSACSRHCYSAPDPSASCVVCCSRHLTASPQSFRQSAPQALPSATARDQAHHYWGSAITSASDAAVARARRRRPSANQSAGAAARW